MRTSAERGTRERILEVAESSLAECGYHGTRLHRIAERVGIQKASLFHYFPSKDDLYRAVLDEGLDETEQTVRQVLDGGGSPSEKIRQLLEAYVEMVAQHPDRTKILLRQSLGDAPASYHQPPDAHRVLSAVVAFVSEGQRIKEFAPIDPVALTLGVVGMVAFFFTSAPVLAPAWCGDPGNPTIVERVKEHVVEVVARCLGIGHEPTVAAAKVAIA
ncbi:MAG TPA: TetR/AcrR family transcriptional regulator [Candidatus Binatia bacterium]|nr:TetR/AcrR family transcriptional regulator [Candidatus Binatia bacterium]